jgi:hypothetical protein
LLLWLWFLFFFGALIKQIVFLFRVSAQFIASFGETVHSETVVHKDSSDFSASSIVGKKGRTKQTQNRHGTTD